MEKIEAYKALDNTIFIDKNLCIEHDINIILKREIIDNIKFGKFIDMLHKDKNDAIEFIKLNICNTIRQGLESYQNKIGNLNYFEDKPRQISKKQTKRIKSLVGERELLLDNVKS